MSNNLKYRTTRVKGDLRVVIDIRLNDECKNGHQDFAITGTTYERNAPGTAWFEMGGGCVHNEILRVAPDLEMFVKLHLSDYLGCPMHAVANGFYFLTYGFNNTPVDDPKFPVEFCEYYRITPDQFKTLKKSETKLQYSIALQSLGVIDQWKAEANAAIKQLEALTGETFEIDSVKSQYTPPTQDEIAAENERIRSGYCKMGA